MGGMRRYNAIQNKSDTERQASHVLFHMHKQMYTVDLKVEEALLGTRKGARRGLQGWMDIIST